METTRRYTLTHLVIAATVVALATLILVRLISIALTSRPGDSPVKVRGGAMTFRTKSGGQMQQVSGNSFCVVLGSPGAKVTLDIFQPKNHTNTPNRSFKLTSQSQIDFFGRTEKGQVGSNNGTRVLITPSCNGQQGVSALFQPESADSGFYANNESGPSQDGNDDPPNDNDSSHSVRFQDLACAAKFTPPNGSGDEDSCENMGIIYVNDAPTGQPTNGKHARCHNGDCLVEFNVQ